MYYKDEIYDELSRINKKLVNNNLFLDLKIVGGAALIFNGINCIETSELNDQLKMPYRSTKWTWRKSTC